MVVHVCGTVSVGLVCHCFDQKVDGLKAVLCIVLFPYARNFIPHCAFATQVDTSKILVEG